jgi:hypothetical protein
MALVVFRSRAAGEIFMFAETAERIFQIIGRDPAERGVITVEQIPDALERLTAAVELEKAELKEAADRNDRSREADDSAARPPAVTLGQRAFPLLEMLRAANKKKVEVTWGV